MNLYSTKGAVNARLVPLVDGLAAAGVSPDQVTLAAVPVALVAGACLLASQAASVAWLPGAMPQVVLLGVMTGVMASYVGITSRAAGGERIYRGVMSKPGRMALLVVACIAAFVLGPADGRAWQWFGPLLLLGTALTLLERIAVAIRQLP
jgi:hypothetical protein